MGIGGTLSWDTLRTTPFRFPHNCQWAAFIWSWTLTWSILKNARHCAPPKKINGNFVLLLGPTFWAISDISGHTSLKDIQLHTCEPLKNGQLDNFEPQPLAIWHVKCCYPLVNQDSKIAGVFIAHLVRWCTSPTWWLKPQLPPLSLPRLPSLNFGMRRNMYNAIGLGVNKDGNNTGNIETLFFFRRKKCQRCLVLRQTQRRRENGFCFLWKHLSATHFILVFENQLTVLRRVHLLATHRQPVKCSSPKDTLW